MTVAEARKLLVALPDDAVLRVSDGETIYEVTQIEMVPVIDDRDGYVATEDGAISVAVVARYPKILPSPMSPSPSDSYAIRRT